jgi:hypothetical protein
MSSLVYPHQAMLSMDDLIHANDRLRTLIYTIEKLSLVDDNSCIEAYSATSLARRIAPTSIPPTFVRFNGESGPIEPMPSLFQVPFPTLENFKMSLLNSNISANRLTSAARAPPITTKHLVESSQPDQPVKNTEQASREEISQIRDDEYADDF